MYLSHKSKDHIYVGNRNMSVLLLMIGTIVALIVCFALGEIWYINDLVLLIYILSLFYIYIVDRDFFVKFVYLLAVNTLYLLGIYSCERNSTFLYEIAQKSRYSNSFSIAAFATELLFLFAYLSHRRKDRTVVVSESTSTSKTNYIYFIGWIVILLEVITVIELIRKGSNLQLSLNRFQYSRTVMSPFANKVKANLILCLPVFHLSRGKFKKLQLTLYLVLYGAILYLSGEKFGPYLRLFCLMIVVFPNFMKVIRKYSLILILVAVALIGIVYLQYSQLLGYTYQEFVDYLLNRLSQQGQIWWSIYTQHSGNLLRMRDFSHEPATSLLGQSATAWPYAGQWKMMYEAAGGVLYVQNRIREAVPYTSTTMASTFYYFGILGLVVVYPALGVLYNFVISNILPNARNRNLLSAILAIKIFTMTDYLMTASNLQDCLSIKGLFIICLFLLSNYFDRKYKLIAVLTSALLPGLVYFC